jgi:hypothetical protein
MAIDTVIYERHDNMRTGNLQVTIDKIDNEVTVVLNNFDKTLKGPKGFDGWTGNLTSFLEEGMPNVLVVTLVNYATTSKKAAPTRLRCKDRSSLERGRST